MSESVSILRVLIPQIQIMVGVIVNSSNTQASYFSENRIFSFYHACCSIRLLRMYIFVVVAERVCPKRVIAAFLSYYMYNYMCCP